MTLHPMFREATAMGIILEGVDQIKLKYPTAVMTALRSSEKSTYAMWLSFFNEGDGSRSNFVVEALLHIVMVCVSMWT